MPYTPPWLTPPDFLGAIRSGAGLGLQLRAQGDAEEKAVEQLRQAQESLMARVQQAQASQALQERELAAKLPLQALQGQALAQSLSEKTNEAARNKAFQEAIDAGVPYEEAIKKASVGVSAPFMAAQARVQQQIQAEKNRNAALINRADLSQGRRIYEKTGVNPIVNTPEGPVVDQQKLQEGETASLWNERIKSLDVKSRTLAQQMRTQNPEMPIDTVIDLAATESRRRDQMKEVLPQKEVDFLEGSEKLIRQVDVLKAALQGKDVTGIGFAVTAPVARIFGNPGLSQVAKVDQLYELLKNGQAFALGGKTLTKNEIERVTRSIGRPRDKYFAKSLETFGDETANTLFDRLQEFRREGKGDHPKFGPTIDYLEKLATLSSPGLRARISTMDRWTGLPALSDRKVGDTKTVAGKVWTWTGEKWRSE